MPLLSVLVVTVFSLSSAMTSKAGDSIFTSPPPLIDKPDVSPDQSRGKAVVRDARGHIMYCPSGTRQWVKAKLGDALRSGDLLASGEKSQVDLFLGDNGPVLRLGPESILVLEILDVGKTESDKYITTHLNLLKGQLMGNVKKLSALSDYMIKTLGNYTEIRGTDFRVCAVGKWQTINGSAVVHAAGETYIVNANEVFNPTNRTVEKGPHSLSFVTSARCFVDVAMPLFDEFSFPGTDQSPFAHGIKRARENTAVPYFPSIPKPVVDNHFCE